MTERLFEIDPYIQEFEAIVTACIEKNTNRKLTERKYNIEVKSNVPL